MDYISSLFLLFILSQHCFAEYELKVLLQSFDNGEGFLANGSHCDPMWYANIQCSISLQICVEVLTGEHSSDVDDCKDKYIDLGQVTNNENRVEFDPDKNFSDWTNPKKFTFSGQDLAYKGFQIKVKATHKGEPIDSFLIVCDEDGSKIHDVLAYGHSRSDAPEPTRIRLAWRVAGKSQFVQPTEAPTTTAGSTETPLPSDCDGYKRRGENSGVKKIKLSNGNSVDVYCDMGGSNAYTVIQSRGNGGDSVNFDKLSWDEYKDKQGVPGWNTNFWLGLDNMRALINSNLQYGLAIQLCCGTVAAKTTFYSNLAMGDEESRYQLNGTSSTALGMAFDNGGTDLYSKFGTTARWSSDLPEMFCDVLESSDGKVQGGTGGWWFGSCSNNLNGHYYDIEKDKDVFANTSKCLLNMSRSLPYGSGIEMRTSLGTTASENAFDGISYTRARMALYDTTVGAPLGTYDFCSKDPPTEATATTKKESTITKLSVTPTGKLPNPGPSEAPANEASEASDPLSDQQQMGDGPVSVSA